MISSPDTARAELRRQQAVVASHLPREPSGAIVHRSVNPAPVRYSRDAQSGKVYDAEHQLQRMLDSITQYPTVQIAGSTVTLHPPLRFGALATVQAYVNTVCDNEGASRLDVRLSQSERWARYHGTYITLPSRGQDGGRWAWREEVVLHEITHHLTPGHGHDGVFCDRYITLLTAYVSPEIGFLTRLLLLDNGAKIS